MHCLHWIENFLGEDYRMKEMTCGEVEQTLILFILI